MVQKSCIKCGNTDLIFLNKDLDVYSDKVEFKIDWQCWKCDSFQTSTYAVLLLDSNEDKWC